MHWGSFWIGVGAAYGLAAIACLAIGGFIVAGSGPVPAADAAAEGDDLPHRARREGVL